MSERTNFREEVTDPYEVLFDPDWKPRKMKRAFRKGLEDDKTFYDIV